MSTATPATIERNVGVHLVEFVVPEGWTHEGLGGDQRFRPQSSGLSQSSGLPQSPGFVVLSDLGPALPAVFASEMELIRELLAEGDLEGAASRWDRLPLRRLFPGERSWKLFSSSWGRIRVACRSAQAVAPEVLDQAFDEALVQVTGLPDPDLAEIVSAVLAELGHDERSDIAARSEMEVSGREAVSIDTWDRLSHVGRRRQVFVLNRGRLLVARMEFGDFSEMEPAFDALVGSLILKSPS